MHYLELDQFIGEHFLVTVHGPLSPLVPLDKAMQETRRLSSVWLAGCVPHPRLR